MTNSSTLRRLGLLVGLVALIALALSSTASAKTAAWHIAGSEFKGEETIHSYGFLTLAIPGQSLTFECTESGNGTISGTANISTKPKYSCSAKALPKCSFEAFETTVSGSATAVAFQSNLFVLRTVKGTGCSWYETTQISTGTINLSNPAPESVKPTVTLSGTGSFGAFAVTISGFTTRELTGARAGQVWGFNSINTYQSSFGSLGTGTGQFNHPAGSEVDAAGNLWVADTNNNRVEQFNSSGAYLGKIPAAGETHSVSAPNDVAIDASGNLWIVEGGLSRISKFTPKGEWIRTVSLCCSGTEGKFNEPKYISIEKKNGNMWITGSGKYSVQLFNSNGEFLKVISVRFADGGDVGVPAGVDVAPNSNVWVAGDSPDRLYKYNEQGELLKTFGSEGSGNGQLNNPGAIEVGANQHVWVVDAGNSRVQEFYEEGEFLSAFGTAGSGVGQFSLSSQSSGLTLDSLGNLWVSDTNNNRVQKWSTF